MKMDTILCSLFSSEKYNLHTVLSVVVSYYFKLLTLWGHLKYIVKFRMDYYKVR